MNLRLARCILTSSILLSVAAVAIAAEPNADTVMQRMKAALEPARPNTRSMTIVVNAADGTSVEWAARQARKRVATGNWMLTVMLSPPSIRGTAQLVSEPPDGLPVQWVYLPAVRRVRKLLPVDGFQAFLDTDFTYADLGFIALHGRKFVMLGSEQRDGKSVFKIQETVDSPWYYSRVINWIAADSSLPVERDFYDPAKALWKVERFDNVTTVDGVPTPLRIRMENVQQHGSSELRFSEVRYDADIPDAIFDPKLLPTVANNPLWGVSQQP